MTKRRITVEELHAKLQAEFASRAGDVCIACRLPRPTYFAGVEKGPNWRLPSLGECDSLCHTLAQELAQWYSERYELVAPAPG